MEKLKPMRFDPYQLVWEKGQKPKDVYMILGGVISNEETDRVLKTGMMFGQDEILFKKDREARMRAELETFTMRISKEDFDVMMDENPDLKN